MKKYYPLFALLLLICLCLASCHKEPIVPPSHTCENLITTQNVQSHGWRRFISNETYVFSSEQLDARKNGTSKYNLLSGATTTVCLRPNCSHSAGSSAAYEDDWCHIPTDSKLYFTYENKIFLQYFTIETTEDGKGLRTDIFAYYDIVTGEHKDLIKIQKNDYEQMYFTFIEHGGYIYYTRHVAQSEKPQSAKDYLPSVCRMKINEYSEKVLFDLPSACGTDRSQLWIPFAVDSDRIYLIDEYTGKIAVVDLDGTNFCYLADGVDGILGDTNNVFYHNGFVYITTAASLVDSSIDSSARNAFFLYRIDCNTAAKQKLTDDYVCWLFVSDQHVYYQMTPNLQPSREQLKEAGDMDYSIHTIKQINHDGSNPTRLQFTAANSQINQGVWGGGDYLFIPMGYQKETSEGVVLGQYTVLLHLQTQSITTLGKTDEMN